MRQAQTRISIRGNEETMKYEACPSQSSFLIVMCRRLSPVMFYNSPISVWFALSFYGISEAMVNFTHKYLVTNFLSTAEHYTLSLKSCISLIILLSPLQYSSPLEGLNDAITSLPVKRQQYQLQMRSFCDHLYVPESIAARQCGRAFPKCGINASWEYVRCFQVGHEQTFFSIIMYFFLKLLLSQQLMLVFCLRQK